VIELLAASLLAVQASPQPEPDFAPLIIGETATLSVMDQERSINVILPAGYDAEPDRTWPVVYMLDGGMSQDLMLGAGLASWNRLWGRSQAVIWVGVETKDRQRELLPKTNDPEEATRFPTAGASAAFRSWLTDEVTQMISDRYRVNDDSFLIGESAAGHFVLETWFKNPSAFTGYAAISPSLQWDLEALSFRIANEGNKHPPLYLSLADEGGATETGVLRVVNSMSELQLWCFSDRRDELRHANSLHGLLPEALQFLLPTDADWLAEYGLSLRCEQRGPNAE